MNAIDADEARKQLLQLLARVEKGEEIIIINEGKPVALLTAYPNSQKSDRIPGRLRGQCTVPDDFYQTDEELIALFEG
ncbi:MAG: type II toxin-antitoxin system Phd/YefM family antitoxin [Crocosphaera sp.]